LSTAALHIIELIKKLPESEQKAVRDALSASPAKLRRKLQRLSDGSYFNPHGIPNDDPSFQTIEKIEAERHQTAGPPPPVFD
jgi:hypothetical protein